MPLPASHKHTGLQLTRLLRPLEISEEEKKKFMEVIINQFDFFYRYRIKFFSNLHDLRTSFIVNEVNIVFNYQHGKSYHSTQENRNESLGLRVVVPRKFI